MREIKFRAWDKSNEEMINFDEIEGINFEGEFLYIGTSKNLECMLGFEFAELMQYTGLKDKHGKEIYEGDIIRYEHSAVGSIVRVVQYKYGMYGVEGNVKGTQIPFANILNSTREIIGNIYENPELLEG